ncbi:hypothetical protein IscW_ISCW010964 [Ixodes scapularis]|uniref:Uncharacterized protein n=1 Tax=Ixodes scapularis TaxID=6945 RepID=B7Q9C0_IXOSC|nr:hypothetical protein IscW_ISCW010964 [Ixodes scapularis]|eukprot:XP_002405702.1 hypothetical protein IscW_ISCW010964 [Ixodes scapularis]
MTSRDSRQSASRAPGELNPTLGTMWAVAVPKRPPPLLERPAPTSPVHAKEKDNGDTRVDLQKHRGTPRGDATEYLIVELKHSPRSNGAVRFAMRHSEQSPKLVSNKHRW